MNRYVCIHGHFYQPPRENPWLEAIELQDSAYPYHDWNERITAESYAPNAAARILNERDYITKILNNYSRISFNFGPTLLAWLESNAPEVYRAILNADLESRKRYSGHGSAIAQPYNHPILPLMNRRDKYTQVLWGIRDFEHRFGRSPEGMWLPETAVDVETLEILAELGIRFTILSPYQAGRVRPIGQRQWRDARGGRLDPTTPYLQRLPSGRTITLFFYDAPISQGIAFEGLLNRGENLAHRLVGAFNDSRPWPQLVHIATDGETYGHHHAKGEMALAYALDYIETNNLARLTNYGEFLENFDPTHEVEIVEKTAWSCSHGVGRWATNCGCASGGYPGWNQEWRAPLRAALDWLRDDLAAHYEELAGKYLKEPWKARDDYIAIILDRSPDRMERFLAERVTEEYTGQDRTTVLKLLELQRHALLMYTSCGWFFDELSGIETVQVIQYAGRAVQLAQDLFGNGTEERFLELLERAKSNVPEHADGRQIYEKFVRPAMVDLAQVGAHYALSSLFESYPEQSRIYSYNITRQTYRRLEAGRAGLAVGRVTISSEITLESADLSFGVLHFGDHNLIGGVRPYQGTIAFEAMTEEVSQAFEQADLPQALRLLDKHFQGLTYSLKSLFRDEQRQILRTILGATLDEAEMVYRGLYERHAPLMRFMTELRTPLPNAFRAAAEFALNTSLRRELAEERPDAERVAMLRDEALRAGAALDEEGLSFTLTKTIEAMVMKLRARPTDLGQVQALLATVNLARTMPFEVNLWTVQNIYYEILQRVYPGMAQIAGQGDETAALWADAFQKLGELLRLEAPQIEVVEEVVV